MSQPLPPIIDVHSHSMLASWRNALKKKHGSETATFEGVAIPDWDPATAIDVMDQNGIQAMLLSNPVGTKDFTSSEAVPLARQMNEELASIIQRHPTRFGAFAVLPLQDIDACVKEVEYCLDTLEFDGVCLQTSFEGAYPGDSRFEPIFAELDRRRSVAFVHPATPAYSSALSLPLIPGIMEYPFDSTRAVASLVLSGMRRRFPDFRYISTHGGGTIPYLAHRIAFVAGRRGSGYGTELDYEGIMADFRNIHYDLAIATTKAQLAAMQAFVPVNQLLMGFDYPMVAASHIQPMLRGVLESGLFDDHELAAIARNNARALLPRLAKRLGT